MEWSRNPAQIIMLANRDGTRNFHCSIPNIGQRHGIVRADGVRDRELPSMGVIVIRSVMVIVVAFARVVRLGAG